MKITRFEEIESWKKARALANDIYKTTNSGEFGKDFELRKQIRRAAISILSNIAEGFERGGDREFIRFLAIAKGSCGEVRAQLYVAFDQNYVSAETFNRLSSKANEVGNLLYGFMRYLMTSASDSRSTARGSSASVKSSN